MSRPVRFIQVLAAVVFFLAGFPVVLRVTATPWPPGGADAILVNRHAQGPPRRPIPEMTTAVERWSRSANPEAVWNQRLWYPWFAAAFWLLALLWGRRGARARWQGGALLWSLTLAILALEAAYLYHDYHPFLPGTAGTVEGCGVFAMVAFLLLYRRASDRRVDAIEATVASQAILGFAHLMTLPSTMARPWIEFSSVDVVVRAVFQNFRLPFWIACGALLLASVPVYLGQRRASLPAADPERTLAGL